MKGSLQALQVERRRLHRAEGGGGRLADGVVGALGSWRFIVVQSIIVLLWIGVNLGAWALRWDPYPFILLNLVFSTQAAYASPLILMAANRASEVARRRDDLEAVEVHELFVMNRRQLEMLELLRAGALVERGPDGARRAPRAEEVTRG